MHIVEFFKTFAYREPSPAKLHHLERCLGPESLHHPNLSEVKALALGHKAMDDYMSWVIGQVALGCGYVNFPLSALANFAVHQLTMRRFPECGSQILLQVGCFTGEEFLCGTARNLFINCHLVPLGACRDVAEIRLAHLDMETPPATFPVPLAQYLENVNQRVGALVLANLGDTDAYAQALEAVWPRLDTYADVVICGNDDSITALQAELRTRGVPCTGIFRRPRAFSRPDDESIFVVSKEQIDYRRLVAIDFR